MGKLTKVDSLLVLRASEKRFRSGQDGESRNNCSVCTCQNILPTFSTVSYRVDYLQIPSLYMGVGHWHRNTWSLVDVTDHCSIISSRSKSHNTSTHWILSILHRCLCDWEFAQTVCKPHKVVFSLIIRSSDESNGDTTSMQINVKLVMTHLFHGSGTSHCHFLISKVSP